MQRRSFIKTTGMLASSTMLFSGLAGSAEDRQPNILLITADDLGWNDLGCYGNEDISTPNIDKMAEDGVRFTNAFVTAPSCSASRASIITGQAPHSVHVLGLTHVHPKYQMSPEVPTLPDALQNAGYKTAINGKWHVAAFKNTKKYGYGKRMGFMTVKSSKAAKSYISKNKDKPFYLEMNFMQCHRPDGNGHYFQMDPDFPVDPDSIKTPDYWQIPNWPEIREDVAAYYSQTQKMDLMVGEVFAHLEKEGLTENTLVVFVSDNGPPFPGCKVTCYDRGIGTPMIMKWPGRMPNNKTVDGLVSTIDIMPTCLDAAGVSIPQTVQGKSLLPLIDDKTNSVHDEIFGEVTFHVDYAPMRAIRTNEWKYIDNLSPDPTGLDQCEKFDWAIRAAKEPGQKCCVPRPPQELFDLLADPDEKTNLANDPDYADIKTKLAEKLKIWRDETNDPFPDLS